uniref:Uncharacterized protein n=1 Tax=Meloidogyne enterolobii TaxID=390850 RepID=A0A6V7V1S6_MELEN|nr:unnamed protein product [Meloidogyne enterolobii]
MKKQIKMKIFLKNLLFVDGQNDPILRKIINFKKPPVILSLERPKENKHFHKHKNLNKNEESKVVVEGIKLLHEGGGGLKEVGNSNELLLTKNSLNKKSKKKHHKKIKTKIEGIPTITNNNYNNHHHHNHKSSKKQKQQIYSSTRLPTTSLYF